MQNLAALLMQMERIESEVNSRLTGLQDRLVQGESGGGLVTATGDIWFNSAPNTSPREKLCQAYELAARRPVTEAVNNTIKEARKILKSEIGGVIGGQVPPEFANFFGRGFSGH